MDSWGRLFDRAAAYDVPLTDVREALADRREGDGATDV